MPDVRPGDPEAGRKGGAELWRRWFEAVGVDFTPRTGMFVSHASLSVQLAAEGRGLAISRSSLAADDLATGRLVRPFATTIPSIWNTFCVTMPSMNERKPVQYFREWLVEEGRDTVRRVAQYPAVLEP